ncbi:MAG: hypothetical protein NTY80_00345 [candidate division SR1 bacterium]|nr:hypothetical protein [candidate division SR1 bacterium]
MTAEKQLQVEENKEQVKNAIGDKDKKSVDTFVKTLKDEGKKAEKNNKENYDLKIKTAKETNKTEEIKDNLKKEKQEKGRSAIEGATIEAFNKQSPAVIDAIAKNIETNFDKIGNTKGFELSVFENAKKAFETDIASFNITNPEVKNSMKKLENWIALKQIDARKDWPKEHLAELKTFANAQTGGPDMSATVTSIQTKLDIISSQEEKNTQKLLNKATSETNSKEAIENKKNYDLMINSVRKSDSDKSLTIKKADIKQDSNEYKFMETIAKYNSIGIKDLDAIKIVNAQANDAKYPLGTKYIELEKTTNSILKKGNTSIAGITFSLDNDGKLKKDGLEISDLSETYKVGTTKIQFKKTEKGEFEITTTVVTENTPGTQDDMHKLRAEKSNIKTINWNTEKPLAMFDDRGNYRAFEKYLSTTEDTIGNSFKTILEKINGYTPDKLTGDAMDTGSGFKNGYANVLTDYLIRKNDASLNADFTSFLTKPNPDLNVLGGDKTTRSANYDKLIPMRNRTLNTADKQKIIEVGMLIKNQEKLSPIDAIGKGFNSLVEQFGPMFLSAMKMFGFGKGSLTEMFPNFKEKINKMFGKEFGLDKEEVKVINSIATKGYSDKELFSGQEHPPTDKQLKDKFDDIDNYLEKISSKENCRYINVSILQKGLNVYNKNKKSDININDIITIETDSDKKQSIKEINNTEAFTGAMKCILEDEATRTKIATTNEEIQTAGKEKPNINSQGIPLETAKQSYGIHNQQDIVRYLTASLFSNKDLSYVMTENELKGEGRVNPPETIPEKKLTFKDDYAKDGVVTKAGASKMIHEVMDYSTAPSNLLFTPKLEKSAKQIEKGKTIISGKEVDTYVYTDNKKERVKINEGDKIEAVSETTNVEEKKAREKMAEETNNNKLISDFQNDIYKNEINFNDFKGTESTAEQFEKEILKPFENFLLGTTEYNGKKYDNLSLTIKYTDGGEHISRFARLLRSSLVYWSIKQKANSKDDTYGTDKISFDEKIIQNFNTNKQAYGLLTPEGNSLTIKVSENDKDQGKISISKDTKGKLTIERKEETTAKKV